MTHNQGQGWYGGEYTEERKFQFLTGELGKVLIKGKIRLRNCAYCPSWGPKFQGVERAMESMNMLAISSQQVKTKQAEIYLGLIAYGYLNTWKYSRRKHITPQK